MIRRFLLSAIAALALGAPVFANPYEGMMSMTVLPGWRSADGSHVAALHISLSDGWKTYWRAPGDAGVPPVFDWQASTNFRDAAITWPVPEVIGQNGLRSIGYSDSVTLPITVTPVDAGRDIRLSGRIDMGICNDICVPVSVEVSADLPAGNTQRDPRITAALVARPWSADEAEVSRVTCDIAPIEDGLRLRAKIDMPSAGGREIVILETANPEVWVSEASTARQGGRLTAEVDMMHVEGKPFAVQRSGVRITVLGSSHAVDIQGCSAAG